MKNFRIISLFAFGLAFTASVQAGSVESAFSPDGGAEALVIRTIDSAHSNIRMAAFSFTSPQVMKGLIGAKRRGIDVRIVVDDKANQVPAGKSAMNLLASAGIPLRTISIYKIHHDKYIVVDGLHVETGSFNFTKSAADNNSENVVVVWNDSANASRYLKHWESRWNKAQDWVPSY